METIIRVPCKEPYAYLEAKVEGTAEQAVAKYYELKRAVEGSDDSPQKLYDMLMQIFDSDMTKWGTTEDYVALSEQQKAVIQSLKRLYKRLQVGKRELDGDDEVIDA